MASTLRVVVILALLGYSAESRAVQAGANPIRKVVTLLQNMQKEIEATGVKEKDLFDKFMCYCSNNNGELSKSIADSKARAEDLAAKVKEETAMKLQNEQDLIHHKQDRQAATDDLAKAASLREKESAQFEAEKADSETNIKAMASAIPALEKGMAGASFVQMPEGDRVRKIVESYGFRDDNDRRNVLAFLEQSGDFVPQSGQIVGILKQIKDEMETSLAGAVKDEANAATGFGELKASKESEIMLATKAIETKQTRAGELAVGVVQTQDDLEDTEAEVDKGEKFAATLQQECATKEKDWAERQKLRSEEIAAIGEVIGMLNDDDALDLFKKTIPSAALLAEERTGFLQRSNFEASSLSRAQAILAEVAAHASHSKLLQLLLFTLNSKLKARARMGAHARQNSTDVTKMVDDMIVIEGKEQASDDKTKPWCNGEFDKSAREESTEKSEIDALEASIQEQQDMIAAINDQVATEKAEIAELDKAVAEATEQRKEEHENYLTATQLTSTAIELFKKATNRLNKFYNPVLYKAAPVAKEMSMEEKILAAGGGFAQVSSSALRVFSAVAPPPAPETFGAYKKSSEKSSGVLALMDMIVKELEDDMKDGEYEEKVAQKDYQELMSDSAESREGKVKSITDKENAKAKLGEKKIRTVEKETADFADVESIHKYVNNLHHDCDFILDNYDYRKEARASEVEALKNAKAILAGASYR